MNKKLYQPFIWMTTFLILVGMACQLSSPSTPEPVAVTDQPPTQEVIATQEVAPQPPSGSDAISSLDELEKAVIYIEAQGSYRDPSEGWQVNVGGSGTGFLIDPSGIAVTNNHVVAGSATLKVWLAGDTEPRTARVLGVAECSDLAVIEIDGDNFPYLDWYQDDIKVGMDVYTAGYPISGAGVGYSLTKGIVSKASGSVDWTVAAVDQIIEHTAKVNPGNSGGPLVDQNAKVVGVNFGFTSTLDQNYAVERDEAIAVINQLRTGVDVDSLGINGVAVDGELQGNPVVGIWVRSVKSGSPADKARIQAGDIVLEVESKVLNDGTLGGYCEVVRSHQVTDTLNVTVLRADTLEILEGQFNGRELEYVTALGTTANPEPESGQGDPGATASGELFFATEFDDADALYPVTVPETENFEAFTEDGLLYIEVKDRNSNVYTFYDLDIANPDVRIDADVETVGGPNRNNISLVCRATSEGWYEFSMNSGGYWYIWKYENGDYTNLAEGASYSINLQKAANSLTATCIGRELTFYVNGVTMGSATDNTFKDGGQVGVSVSTFDVAGAAVEFDLLVASVP
ncbi:MAG TPA: trypsin-like peptidase domain-containing protein [Anaerolineales bacterium]|nr:trypsin-like peptidase domain-containing protein [Anaerolineales bacterium]